MSKNLNPIPLSDPNAVEGSDPQLVALLGTTLADAELRFAAVVESLAEGLAIFDCGGVLRYCNSLFEQLTGYTREEMYGKKIYEIFFPAGSAEQDEYFQHMLSRYRARRTGEAEAYQSYIFRKDGQRRWVETKAGPLRDSTGQIIGSIGANTDITEKRVLEEQLRWSQRMEAVGRLAGGVSHDFNNLLTAIYGYSDIILRNLPITDPNYRRVRLIKQSTESACRLTRQLLTLSRRSLVQKEHVALNTLVDDTLEIIHNLLGGQIALVRFAGEKLPPVLADPSELQQVLINLVINARDAMSEGGRITIQTHEERVEEKITSGRGHLPAGHYVVLSVEDTGAGIEPEVMPHLFEPFFTTKKSAGTGLGLSTSYALVKQLQGEIFVESDPGKRTVFQVYLPASSQEAPLRRIDPKPAGSLWGTERILVVEDEDVVRQLLLEVLKQTGYTVLSATDGAEALEIVRQLQGNREERLDLIVSDVVMPNVNGLTLATTVLQLDPDLPLLLMSGCTTELAIRERIEELGVPFISKPFAPQTLLETVRSILDRKYRAGAVGRAVNA